MGNGSRFSAPVSWADFWCLVLDVAAESGQADAALCDL